MKHIHLVVAAATLIGQPAWARTCPALTVDLVTITTTDMTVITVQNGRCDLLIAPRDAGERLVVVEPPRIGTVEETDHGLLYRHKPGSSASDAFLVSHQSSPDLRATVMIGVSR